MSEHTRGNPEAGHWLRWLRKDRDLTQEQLAEKAATTVDTIASIETARRRPTPETISKILDCLEIPEEVFHNHVRWFRKLTLPEYWEPWRAKEWRAAESPNAPILMQENISEPLRDEREERKPDITIAGLPIRRSVFLTVLCLLIPAILIAGVGLNMFMQAKEYRVLVDTRHDHSQIGQVFLEKQVDHIVFVPASTEAFSTTELAKYDALVIYYAPLAFDAPTFSAQEIDAIKAYIQQGGGVLLIGLGWTWSSYIKEPMDDYPLNQIGSDFGFYFTSGLMADKKKGAVVHGITEINANHPLTRGINWIATGVGAQPGVLRVTRPAVPIVWGSEQKQETYGITSPSVIAAVEIEGGGRLVAVQHPDYALDYLENNLLMDNIVRWLTHQL